MKMKLFFMLGWFGLVFGLSAQVLTLDQMISDVALFKKALEAKHPEMYRYTSPEAFENLTEVVKSGLHKEMTVREFYVAMMPLVSALHCGHTKWIAAGKDLYYPFFTTDLFPLKLHVNKDKAFILSHFNGEEAPKGAEVISVNGKPVAEIISHFKEHLTFGDGYSEGGKYYQLNQYFPGLYSTLFGIQSAYNIQVRLDGEVRNLSYSGVSFEQIKNYLDTNSSQRGPFHFETLEGNIGWLDIDRFYAYPNEDNFKKFLKNSFDRIQSEGIKELVIDLRGNEGGNENWGIELYRYLAKEPFRYYERISVKKRQKVDFESKTSFLFKLASLFNKNGKYGREFTVQKGLKKQKLFKNAYHGKVYLLLGGQSFSVTTEFASRFQSDSRGKIIGSETAGGYAMNTSGFFSIVNLPNSNIDLGIPLLGFHMANLKTTQAKDRGILPDFPVELSVKDIIGQKDPVRDFTLNLIRQSSFSN
ncbi:S41 family peptidase [Fontibacter flavus]|uniref:S41 family peptidase n=1 Tax=Fontibacter flavus TaxID=654838 RepID=A0ABV6FTN5_9BACT